VGEGSSKKKEKKKRITGYLVGGLGVQSGPVHAHVFFSSVETGILLDNTDRLPGTGHYRTGTGMLVQVHAVICLTTSAKARYRDERPDGTP
jgi:hypothetical protein